MSKLRLFVFSLYVTGLPGPGDFHILVPNKEQFVIFINSAYMVIVTTYIFYYASFPLKTILSEWQILKDNYNGVSGSLKFCKTKCQSANLLAEAWFNRIIECHL